MKSKTQKKEYFWTRWFVRLGRHKVHRQTKDRPMQEALEEAIEYCIDHGILSEFLKKYRAEVLGMLLEEFAVEKYERTIKKEGFEEGHTSGFQDGMQQMSRLTVLLLEQNRTEELLRAAKDKKYQQQLLEEFNL